MCDVKKPWEVLMESQAKEKAQDDAIAKLHTVKSDKKYKFNVYSVYFVEDNQCHYAWGRSQKFVHLYCKALTALCKNEKEALKVKKFCEKAYPDIEFFIETKGVSDY